MSDSFEQRLRAALESRETSRAERAAEAERKFAPLWRELERVGQEVSRVDATCSFARDTEVVPQVDGIVELKWRAKNAEGAYRKFTFLIHNGETVELEHLADSQGDPNRQYSLTELPQAVRVLEDELIKWLAAPKVKRLVRLTG